MAVRKKNRGLIYLRRSSGRQEMSLGGQLAWAIDRAREEGVAVDAAVGDLDHMQRLRMASYKDIRLDDAISGADMTRPGFIAVQADVMSNPRVSHLFVHMRDRFGRPQDAMQMAVIEKSIRMSGATIVLSNGIGLPLNVGEGDLGEDLKIIVEYYMSGDFLRKLSERIITAQRHIASPGGWTGANAQYGCTRVLIDAQGNVLEELPPGRSVRQPGCHVQIRPKDQNKIGWWVLMLDLSATGWGAKRIANLLNELGVPSPDAGKIRRDRGVPHVNDGKWNHRTVLELLRNPTLIGEQRYGRRSMGTHRRLDSDGHRLLKDSDRTENGTTRVVHNELSVQVRKPTGFEAAYDADVWQAIQDGIDARGRSQKGIARVRDLAKYPLSCRVIDMTDDCGSVMYARTSGNRPLYTCGRYMKGGASACENNSVDAEAMLTMVLRYIERFAGDPNILNRLEVILEAKLKAGISNPNDDRSAIERRLAREQLDDLVGRADALVQTLRGLTHPALIRKLENEYAQLEEDILRAERKIAELPELSLKPIRSISDEVQAALTILTNLSQVVSDPSARAELPNAMAMLGVRAGLTFKSELKGKREVRSLRGGVLVFGDAQLPIELHGRDRVHKHTESGCAPVVTPPTAKLTADGKIRLADGEILEMRGPEHSQIEAGGDDSPPEVDTGVDLRPKEGFSSTKVSRGDRI